MKGAKFKMKVAIICPEYLPVPACNGGAVETLISYLIEDNEKYKDLEIDLYSLYDKKNVKKKYKHTQIYMIKKSGFLKYVCKFINFFQKILNIKLIYRFRPYNINLINMIKKNNVTYDKIIVENCMYLYFDIYKKFGKSTPIYYHMHNDIDEINKPVYLTKFVTKTAEKTLVVSKYLKKRILEVNKSAVVDVLYNCVDIEKFSYNLDKRRIYRKKYNINDNDFVFMFSGRITDDKGVFELISAFNHLNNNNIKLLIVGSTWFGSNKLSDYQKKLNNLSYDNVIFTGYITNDEMPNIYSMSDCVVIPSKWEEPFGVVGLEAMANSKRIIVTRSGGLMEFLNKNNSIVIDKGKTMIKDLTEAMSNLIINRDILKIQNKAYDDLIKNKGFNRNNYFNNFVSLIKK